MRVGIQRREQTRVPGIRTSGFLAAASVTMAPEPAIASTDAHAVAFPMYATGSIGCDGAEDTSNKTGMAILRPSMRNCISRCSHELRTKLGLPHRIAEAARWLPRRASSGRRFRV